MNNVKIAHYDVSWQKRLILADRSHVDTEPGVSTGMFLTNVSRFWPGDPLAVDMWTSVSLIISERQCPHRGLGCHRMI